MRVLEVLKSIEIPKNVDVNVEGRVVTVKGEKGVLTRNFSHAPIS
ncbi:50S ribosomal protein L6, partial [Candidatus Bathyarchaeota archaeon]|nr:50S ribosomal protein L6 [Candidatus Bathyarchaeota archaeon]